jgi:hypothetical protein
MATPKKKAAPADKQPKAKSGGPFKTKKSSAPEEKSADNILQVPQEVAEAIDAFREAQDQAKFFEGEATVHKNTVLNYCQDEYAKRLYSGMGTGFKVQGVETIAMYVVQDSSAGLSEEDAEAFSERWGKKAAEELITQDYGSIRFNEKVLEAHYDEVVKALETLPPEILENLFKPMALKAKPHAAENARRFTKNAAETKEILRHLKLKNYIR